jgi:hypothetical protein
VSYSSVVLADTPLAYWDLEDLAGWGTPLTLVPNAGSVAGDAIYCTPVTLNGLSVSFTTAISGGDGIVLMLLDPTQESPSSLGGSGGSGGFEHLAGAGLQFEAYANNAYWLWTPTSGGSTTTQQTHSDTALTGTHSWTVAFTRTATSTYTVVVTKDGSAYVTWTGVSAPDSTVLLGFSAANGGASGLDQITAFSSSGISLGSGGWQLNGAAGSAVTATLGDLSGNGHSVTSGNYVEARPGPLSSGAPGVHFHNSGYAHTAWNPPSLAALTIEYWARKDGTGFGNSRMLASSHTDISSKGFQIRDNGSSNERLDVGWGGGNSSYVASSAVPSLASWHHTVWTYDGATLSFYNDGVLGQAWSVTGTVAADTVGVGLAYNPAYSGDYWTGSMAEVALYSSALSATRVLAHYNAGISSGPPAFRGWGIPI